MERVFITVSGQLNLYEPDSILKTAQLKISNDSFHVAVNKVYFLNDTIMFESMEELNGVCKIYKDSIIFADSPNNSEIYSYQVGEKYLELIYEPLIHSSGNFVWARSDMGIPWGKSGFKGQGKLKRIF